MYKAILFDFDGTLVPSLEFWLTAFKHAFTQHGIDVSESTIVERCFYKNEQDIVNHFKLSSPKTFWGHVGDHLHIAYETPVMYAGAREVLEHCSKYRIPIGLVTSAERAFVLKAMKSLNIAHHFAVIVTADDITNFKPHPEPVLKALKSIRAEPQSTLFVGDYIVDVKAGQAAGTHTALYYTDSHSKFHKREHLAETQPTHMFSDYKELLALLESKTVVAEQKA